MDTKAINYGLMVIIVLIIAFFFKALLLKTSSTITNTAKTLLPNFEFIYV